MSKDSTKIVKLFKAEWCGHCQKFKPVWKEVTAALDKMGIPHETYDADEDEEAIKIAQIDGFPTIQITTGGETFEYRGERSLEAILAAIEKGPPKGQSGGGVNYYQKYLKYKEKYIELKRQLKR